MRAINLPLTMFLCPGCARPLTLIVLASVRGTIKLTCPDCGAQCHIVRDSAEHAPPQYAKTAL